MSIIDEAGQAQLNHFAETARRAFAAKTVVLIVCKDNEEEKRVETAAGIAAPIYPGEKPHKGLERVVDVCLTVTDTLMRKTTGDTCNVVVKTPDGYQDVESKKVDVERQVKLHPGG